MPASDTGRRRLRVGLLVDGLEQPRWVKQAVADVQASGIAEVALVIRNAGVPAARALPRWRRALDRRGQLLFLAYAALDNRRHPVADDPFARESIAELVAGVPEIEVVPRMTKWSDYFSDEDLERIRAHDLDVAVRFGFRILRGGALQIARHGIWSWHHGDNLVNRGGPAGHWEVMLPEATTGSILQTLTEDLDAGKVLYRSWSSTHHTSVRRNKTGYYGKSATFLVRKLHDLHREGEPALRDPLPDADAWHAYSRRLYRIPGNREVARNVSRLVGRSLRRRLRNLVWDERWVLLQRLSAGSATPDVPEPAIYRYAEILPPRDREWADPFPVQAPDGRRYVFFEEYPFDRGKAHLAAVEVDEQGRWGPPRTILDLPHHLSHPFVFRFQDEWYLIPESAKARRVELYRATDFPWEWTHDRTLLDGVAAADATLVEHGGRWWMFVNIPPREGMTNWDELHLYWAASPLGPWTPHPRNPVKSDVRNARPAGSLFVHNGILHRPAQDGSRRYGWAIVVNRVERLDEEAFEERPVTRIEPDWSPRVTATHTINAAGGLSVLDAVRRRRRF